MKKHSDKTTTQINRFIVSK